jgi:flagellar basal-body rod modification protein FlgD
MATTAGIWTQHPAAHALLGARPAPMAGPAQGPAGPTDPTDPNSSDTGSATISANDFLTLLVTEMQNQDPTDDTDPNEYIDQLVEVNSLEQLIDINQNLSTALGLPSNGTSDSSSSVQAPAGGAILSPASGAPAATHPAQNSAAAARAQSSVSSAVAAGSHAAHAHTAARAAPGNLGVPAANPSARRVAASLSGRPRAQ